MTVRQKRTIPEPIVFIMALIAFWYVAWNYTQKKQREGQWVRINGEFMRLEDVEWNPYDTGD